MGEKVFLTAFLLSAVYITADSTVTSKERIIRACDGDNKTIPWEYTDPTDMSTVVWHFINSTGTTLIMAQAQGSNAVIYNGFNIKHISNGKVELENLSAKNNGTCRITVTYSTSAPIAVDDIPVIMFESPRGLNFTNSTSGQQITFTCTASYLGGPEPATLYIEVDEVEQSGQTVTVTVNKSKIRCCLKDGPAFCLPNKCITAQEKVVDPAYLKSSSVAVALASVLSIVLIIMIIVGPRGKVVAWNLSGVDIAVIIIACVVALYSLIAGAVSVAKNGDEDKYCDTYTTCNASFGLGIASIILAVVDLVVLVVFIKMQTGGFGERFTCLNKVLPVCKDTEQRGPPDGKPDNHAAKEKQREMKLQIHIEQTQHHKETDADVHKDKPNKEKHEEPSKGRPLPQPSGNNRPMPEIPSDRHKRGLSANFHDDRDTPLDDNILHTLPVAKKPKNALDPVNTEGQSKNTDDQPKKKKKKKKDRDTRSDDIEDNIDSHGKVLAF